MVNSVPMLIKGVTRRTRMLLLRQNRWLMENYQREQNHHFWKDL